MTAVGDTRRLKVLYFTHEAILAPLKTTPAGNWIRCVEGLPADAELRSIAWSRNLNAWRLVIHSFSFPPVPIATALPSLDPPLFAGKME